jgi:hypothetical protein
VRADNVECLQGHLRFMATHYEKQAADDTPHRDEVQPLSVDVVRPNDGDRLFGAFRRIASQLSGVVALRVDKFAANPDARLVFQVSLSVRQSTWISPS